MTRSIFNMFGQSPVQPLQQHMATALASAELLLPFFDAVLEKDWSKAIAHQQQIAALEKEADNLKKDLRLSLPKGLFLPIHRSDVLELIGCQDHIANKAQDIAGLILGRHMEIPSALAVPLRSYIARSIDAAKQANQAISELDELMETGFSGSEVKLVKEMIIQLDDIEHDTDERQIDLRQKLFDVESQLPPVNVMFLYRIIESIGELANCAQSVGGRLQLLLGH